MPMRAVVALLGLLDARAGIPSSCFLSGPGGAVDPLQHLVARIPAPVGPRELGELERLELAGGRHVRAAAQVDPVALPVQADLILVRDRGDDLGLVELALVLEELPPPHRATCTRRVTFSVRARQLRHALLDGRQVLGRERAASRRNRSRSHPR